MLRRRPPLPPELHPAWRAFTDCAQVIEGGRRTLLATLPAGRVDPAPVSVGLEALAGALDDASAWMGAWAHVPGLGTHWEACRSALAETAAALPRARRVSEASDELEDLLGAVQEAVDPLAAFADAERAWRRRWRVPRAAGATPPRAVDPPDAAGDVHDRS